MADIMIEEAVQDHLAANGHGVVGDDLLATHMADEPDEMLVVYATPGDGPVRVGANGIAVQTAGIQLRARGGVDDPKTPALRAQTAAAFLESTTNEDVSGVRFLSVDWDNGPFPGGADEKNRRTYICNLTALWQPTA